MAENKFWSGLVLARVELKSATLKWFVDGPSGEHLRDFRDIALGVPAVDAERVQFEQFAPVILVEAAVCFLPGVRCGKSGITTRAVGPGTRRDAERLHGIRPDAQPIVEIKQHRRTFRGCHKQIFEFAESMRSAPLLINTLK